MRRVLQDVCRPLSRKKGAGGAHMLHSRTQRVSSLNETPELGSGH